MATNARPSDMVRNNILDRVHGPERRAVLGALQPAFNHWHSKFDSDPHSIRKAPVGIALELVATCDDAELLAVCRRADKRVTVQHAIAARLVTLNTNTTPPAPRRSKKLSAMLARPAGDIAREVRLRLHSQHMTLSWLNAVDDNDLPVALDAAWNHGGDRTTGTRLSADLSYYVSVISVALANNHTETAIRWWDTADRSDQYQLASGVCLAWRSAITPAVLAWAKKTNTGITFAASADTHNLTITPEAGAWAAEHGNPSVMFAAIATSAIDAAHITAWGKLANDRETVRWPHFARSLDTFEAAIAVLAANTKTNASVNFVNFGELLNQWPDASAQTRLHVASMLNTDDLHAWVTGTWAVTTTPDERHLLLGASSERYPDVGFRVITQLCAPVDQSDPQADARRQLAHDIVSKYRGASINALFAANGDAGSHVTDTAVAILTAGLGDNAARWQCAMGLLATWDDSLHELIGVATLLTADDNEHAAA